MNNIIYINVLFYLKKKSLSGMLSRSVAIVHYQDN